MEDENGQDEKLLCVPDYDPAWKKATDITDVSKSVLDRISHFFTVYKDLDEGKWMKVENWVGRDAALKELEASRQRFKG
jgi:inorganic pyrophosphatase